MADRNPRGRGGHHGRGRGRPRRGGNDAGQGETRPVRRDERELEIAAQARRIRELERQLATARLDANHGSAHGFDQDSYLDDEVETGTKFDSITSAGEEDVNPWGERRRIVSRDLGVKVDIPDFEGKTHPDEFIDWLHTVERVFDIKDLRDGDKVKLVALKLRKSASVWWEHIKRRRAREDKPKISTWAKMKKKLMEKFLSVHYRQEAFINYHNLRQGTMSVEEYTGEFDRLRLRCDVLEEDEQIVARYLAGLRQEIADVVHLQQYWSFADVCRLALKVETQLRRKVGNSRFSGRFSGIESNKQGVGAYPTSTHAPTTGAEPSEASKAAHSPNPNRNKGGGAAGKRCFKCQGLGHFATDCPNRQIITILNEDLGPEYDEEPVQAEEHWLDDEEITYADSGEALVVRRALSAVSSERVAGKRCFKCQGLGHLSTDCPNRQIITALDEDLGPEYDEEHVQAEEHWLDGKEITYADSGEALVVRRALSAVSSEDESWLRHNIFHTKCTCEGKVCNVIIDGGSCENVISKTVVDKLGLNTEVHPLPYKLTWFKKGSEVKVSHRCLVKFSIGKKYSDEVWCDVVPMDACHLLLGRPWQFDRKTKHDGFKNTYTFEKDGTTITLGPTNLRKEARNHFVSRSEFLVEVSTTKEAFALVVVKANGVGVAIPPQVVPILEEFADVVPEELPPGLPPMRDIQYCIDFVPGAVITHKAAYRRNPKEHEELYGEDSPLDMVPLPILKQFNSDGEEQTQHIQELHSQIRTRIERQNGVYKERANQRRKRIVFQEGDLVWIHLRKERFPSGRLGKLQPRADGPFRVLQRINDNAYKIALPGKYNVSATFNVADLTPYVSDNEEEETEVAVQDSRTNLFIAGGYDA